MTTLIKRTLLFIIIGLGLNLHAQYHDVKVDAGGLIYGDYGAAYEYGWNDYNSVGARFGYFSKPHFGLIEDRDSYPDGLSQFNITIDYRRFSLPDEGADKKYWGGYAKLRSINFGDELQGLDGETGFALGILYGTKNVYRNGLVFDSYFGAGYYLTSSDYFDEFDSIWGYAPWEIRLGLLVGYRFD